MFVSLTSTAPPATDLGFLLHKHPGRVQRFELPVGVAHVFYPEATEARCAAALLLEVDPVGLVRGRRFGGAEAFALAQYVNDRPYAASSLLAVALGRVFRTALQGRCEGHQDLADRPLPLEVHVPALPARGGADVVRRVFAPLGWQVDAAPVPLDPCVPGWGDSPYVDLRLRGQVRVADALSHLYVLLPVLDDAKHYWVGPDEVDKLVRAGGGWLADHPERELVAHRYLAHQRDLAADAVARLAEVDDAEPEAFADPDACGDGDGPDGGPGGSGGDTPSGAARPGPERAGGAEPGRARLRELRVAAVLEALRAAGAARVVDLGCGQGALLAALLDDPGFSEVVGADVSVRALAVAGRRLGLARAGDRRRERVRLLQSSAVYADRRLAGYDAVVLMEVVEHVDPWRLPALEASVLGAARPATVVVTTPNAEHNVRYGGLAAGAARHPDHRFEWTRAEFAGWASRVGAAYGYEARLEAVGAVDPDVGPPTQMAVLTRGAGS